MIGNVYPFWRCFKVMPLVYDESLSYYEVLCKLTYKINEVIEQLSLDYSEIYKYIDQQDKFTLNSANNYTDSKVSELELVINNQFTVLSDAIKSADQNKIMGNRADYRFNDLVRATGSIYLCD